MTTDRIRERLQEEYPLATESFLDEKAKALLSIVPELQLNLYQWVYGEPLTDVWIRHNYCLRTVMQIRKGDVCDALLALDAYARNPSKEYGLYRLRR